MSGYIYKYDSTVQALSAVTKTFSIEGGILRGKDVFIFRNSPSEIDIIPFTPFFRKLHVVGFIGKKHKLHII